MLLVFCWIVISSPPFTVVVTLFFLLFFFFCGGVFSSCASAVSSSKPNKLASVTLASIASSSMSVSLLFLITSLLSLANFFATKYIYLKGLFALQMLSFSTVLLDSVGLIMEAKNASNNFIMLIPDALLSFVFA